VFLFDFIYIGYDYFLMKSSYLILIMLDMLLFYLNSDDWVW
jgi:hypothetical protein